VAQRDFLIAAGKERSMRNQLRNLKCSFCDRTAERVSRLIAGPRGVYICDQCVAQCNRILAEHPPMS
jgi:ribosomal protein L37AE/L43A